MSQHRGGGPGYSLLPFLRVLPCALFRHKNTLFVQVMCVYSPIPQSPSQWQRCSYCPPPHFGILVCLWPPPARVFFNTHNTHSNRIQWIRRFNRRSPSVEAPVPPGDRQEGAAGARGGDQPGVPGPGRCPRTPPRGGVFLCRTGLTDSG